MSDAVVQREAKGPFAQAWILGLFLLIGLFGFADRQIISALGQPIKRDLNLTDAQLGQLGGIVFALLNTALTIPIARMADRGRRLTFITVGVFFWSIATALCGLAVSFWQLVGARVLVGAGEATGGPATQSVIADYFPREKRASAMAVIGLSIPLGAFTGAAGGGFIAQHMDWRYAFFVASAPGVILGFLLALTVREPERGRYDYAVQPDGAHPSIGAVLKRMVERPAFLHTLLGSTIASAGGFAINFFLAQYFFRRFGLDFAMSGLLMGLISAIPGSICIFAAGMLADRLGRHDPRAYGWTPAAALAIATPLYLVAFLMGSWQACVALLMVTGLFQYAYLPVSNAVYQNAMTPRMRASAYAVVGIFTNLIGAGIGPWVMGALSDRFTGRAFGGSAAYHAACSGARAAETASAGSCGAASAHGLTQASMIIAFVYLWAALHFALAARTMKRDLTAD